MILLLLLLLKKFVNWSCVFIEVSVCDIIFFSYHILYFSHPYIYVVHEFVLVNTLIDIHNYIFKLLQLWTLKGEMKV